ncbi:MAG: TonB-dependent receptor, partial [Pseudomonadota bacterium]
LFEDDAGVTFARREFRDQERDIDQSTALAELVWNTSFGGFEHTVLAGGEYYRRSNSDFFLTSSDSRRAGTLPPNFIVPDLNFFNPVYGLSDPSQFNPFVETDRDIDFDQWGFYIQDQVKVSDRLLLSLGGRFEGFSEDIDSTQTVLVTGVANRSVADQDDDAFTVRLGAVYDVTDNIAAYANYSTGFNPQGTGSQAEDNGGPFDPEEGELFELGAKVDLFGGGLYLQTAIYQITKTNVLIADPTPGAPTGALASVGEARSRGFELDIVGDISDNWTFTFNYAFNETKIIEGSDEIRNAVGDEFANAPDHQIGFWTRYDINGMNSAIAFGGSFVSEQISLSGQEVQSYAVFDATWISTWDNIQLQLNARNLFDESFAESGFLGRTGHFPGDPRVLRAELVFNF